MFNPTRLSLTILTILLSALAISAQELNIDLGAYHGTPSDLYGAASGQTGPWNTVELGVTSSLTDAAGAPTMVSATVSADLPGNSNACTGDSQACLSDQVHSHHGTWTVDLSGLVNGNYEVYLYAPSHTSVATGNMLVNGIVVASITGTSDCDLTNGTSWVGVSVEVLDGTLSITGDSIGSGFDYAGLAALQLTRSTRMGWNIDVGAEFGRPSAAYGAASGQAGSWNTVGLGFNSYLLDTEGFPTAVNASVSAGSELGSSGGCSAGDSEACIADNIYTHNGIWTIDLTSLPNGVYEVFLYAPSHTSVATGNMVINDIAVPSIAGTSNCDLTIGISWVRVRTAVFDGTLSMTGGSAGSGYDYAGLAALQLVRLTDRWWNIDLGAGLGTPSDSFGAVAEQPGRWNTVGLGATSHLVDTAAAVTTVDITVSAQVDSGEISGCPTADENACVADYIFTENGTWTIDFSDLTNGIYDVFLYAPRHSSVATGNMLINGIALSSILGASSCDLTEGIGSAWARVEVVDGTLSMTGDSAGSGSPYAGVAALQLTRSDILFDDDFESGDVSAWFTASP